MPRRRCFAYSFAMYLIPRGFGLVRAGVPKAVTCNALNTQHRQRLASQYNCSSQAKNVVEIDTSPSWGDCQLSN